MCLGSLWHHELLGLKCDQFERDSNLTEKDRLWKSWLEKDGLRMSFYHRHHELSGSWEYFKINADISAWSKTWKEKIVLRKFNSMPKGGFKLWIMSFNMNGIDHKEKQPQSLCFDHQCATWMNLKRHQRGNVMWEGVKMAKRNAFPTFTPFTVIYFGQKPVILVYTWDCLWPFPSLLGPKSSSFKGLLWSPLDISQKRTE